MNYDELISRTLPDALETWNDQTRWYSEFIQELKDALIEEANERDWCDMYDKFVSRLNSQLIVNLEEREREYEVQATFIITVSTTIKARDEDDANDQAGDMDLSSFDVSIRGSYDDIEYSNHEVELA